MQQAPQDAPGSGVQGVMEDARQLANPTGQLKESLDNLDDFGGFDLLADMVDGLKNMNPAKKAAKRIFLEERSFADQREQMKSQLAMWIKVLNQNSGSVSEAVEACQEEAEKARQNLSENLLTVHEATRQLEVAYRSLGQFFANAGQSKLHCLSLMNVDKEELADPEGREFQAVRDELNKHYDRLSLKDNYSLLVTPGYLGDKQAVNMWGQMAYRNKVLLVTDYADMPDLEMLVEGLDQAHLSDTDAYLANVVMACNYILGRKKSDPDNEDEEDLYLPPSAAIAGRLVNTEGTPISQGIAGKKYGTIDNARGTRLELLKSELSTLIDKGVVPMAFDDNRVMAFSNRSLYNGATAGLQEYPIVRVFDWIGKVFMNFFNDEAFKNWDSRNSPRELRTQLISFLEDYKGPGKLIEDFKIEKIERDEKTKDIHIDVNLTPFYAAKNFYIQLTGHNNADGSHDWENKIS